MQVFARTDAAGAIVTCSTNQLGMFTDELLANNGYIIFPNGLIMQWGRAIVGSNTTLTVSFPRPFTVIPYSITLSGTNDSSNNAQDNWPAVYRHPNQTTLTTFQVRNPNQNADQISWFAIGR